MTQIFADAEGVDRGFRRRFPATKTLARRLRGLNPELTRPARGIDKLPFLLLQPALLPFQAALLSFQAALLPFQAALLPFQAALLPFQAALLPFQPALLPFQPALLPFQPAPLFQEPALLLVQPALLFPNPAPFLPQLAPLLPRPAPLCPQTAILLQTPAMFFLPSAPIFHQPALIFLNSLPASLNCPHFTQAQSAKICALCGSRFPLCGGSCAERRPAGGSLSGRSRRASVGTAPIDKSGVKGRPEVAGGDVGELVEGVGVELRRRIDGEADEGATEEVSAAGVVDGRAGLEVVHDVGPLD